MTHADVAELLYQGFAIIIFALLAFGIVSVIVSCYRYYRDNKPRRMATRDGLPRPVKDMRSSIEYSKPHMPGKRS
jgi:hypothetical protein